jgi:hypothetical protein
MRTESKRKVEVYNFSAMCAAGRRALAITAMCVCLAAAGCGGSSSPTTPTAPPGFSGQWSGVTQQGQPITFTISAEEKVTSIVVGYNFNGCSGTQTYSNLALEIKPQIECIPAPCPADLSSYRSIAHDTGDPFQGPSTSIRGFFTQNQGLFMGQGAAYFRNYPGCGTAQTGWSASRK